MLTYIKFDDAALRYETVKLLLVKALDPPLELLKRHRLEKVHVLGFKLPCLLGDTALFLLNVELRRDNV